MTAQQQSHTKPLHSRAPGESANSPDSPLRVDSTASFDNQKLPHLPSLPLSVSVPEILPGRLGHRSKSFFGSLSSSRTLGGLDSTAPTRPQQVQRAYTQPVRGISADKRDCGTIPDIAVAAGSQYLQGASGFEPVFRPFENKSMSTENDPQAVGQAVEPARPTTAAAARDKHSRHRSTQSAMNIIAAPVSASITVTTQSNSDFTGVIEPVATAQQTSLLKRRLPNVLSRTKSLRADAQMNVSSSSAPSTPVRATTKQTNGTPGQTDASVRIVPPQKERSLSKTALKPMGRTRSEERSTTDKGDSLGKTKQKKDKLGERERDKERDQHPLAQGYRKNNGSGFFGEFKSSSSKAADGLGKAGKGFFSRLTRSTSSNEKVGAGPEEEYEPRILKLPLIQQTRETRIAKSYDHCRDKTEFWMPALPWRCIDYLNGKCEEEGLYRVSGGLTNVRRWRKRFDIERDINLLDEPDLYDASIIASLFKEWIRELPEEIFPKSLQVKVSATLPAEVPGTKPVPQALRDELSNLPPFNYYLLFAITCHLSLLLSHEAKNKMTLDNLYRCFNQSLKLDGRIFYTLVGDWRQCWQGCYTEDDFLRAEYDYLNTPYPQHYNVEPDRRPAPASTSTADERAMTSSSGSVVSNTGRSTPENPRPATSHTQPSNSTTESDNDVLSPSRKQQRSSSDVTGISPMKTRNSINPH